MVGVVIKLQVLPNTGNMSFGIKVNSEGTNLPSEFKDPFTNDAVDSVDYTFNKRRSFMRDDKFHKATVFLVSGDTRGRQDFYDDDPDILRIRVDNFINNLK